MIERVAIVGIEIKVDGRERVGKRLGLLAALHVHPSEIPKGKRSRLCARLFRHGSKRGTWLLNDGSGSWARLNNRDGL
jgi:hypothetical protein